MSKAYTALAGACVALNVGTCLSTLIFSHALYISMAVAALFLTRSWWTVVQVLALLPVLRAPVIIAGVLSLEVDTDYAFFPRIILLLRSGSFWLNCAVSALSAAVGTSLALGALPHLPSHAATLIACAGVTALYAVWRDFICARTNPFREPAAWKWTHTPTCLHSPPAGRMNVCSSMCGSTCGRVGAAAPAVWEEIVFIATRVHVGLAFLAILCTCTMMCIAGVYSTLVSSTGVEWTAAHVWSDATITGREWMRALPASLGMALVIASLHACERHFMNVFHTRRITIADVVTGIPLAPPVAGPPVSALDVRACALAAAAPCSLSTYMTQFTPSDAPTPGHTVPYVRPAWVACPCETGGAVISPATAMEAVDVSMVTADCSHAHACSKTPPIAATLPSSVSHSLSRASAVKPLRTWQKRLANGDYAVGVAHVAAAGAPRCQPLADAWATIMYAYGQPQATGGVMAGAHMRALAHTLLAATAVEGTFPTDGGGDNDSNGAVVECALAPAVSRACASITAPACTPMSNPETLACAVDAAAAVSLFWTSTAVVDAVTVALSHAAVDGSDYPRVHEDIKASEKRFQAPAVATPTVLAAVAHGVEALPESTDALARTRARLGAGSLLDAMDQALLTRCYVIAAATAALGATLVLASALGALATTALACAASCAAADAVTRLRPLPGVKAGETTWSVVATACVCAGVSTVSLLVSLLAARVAVTSSAFAGIQADTTISLWCCAAASLVLGMATILYSSEVAARMTLPRTTASSLPSVLAILASAAFFFATTNGTFPSRVYSVGYALACIPQLLLTGATCLDSVLHAGKQLMIQARRHTQLRTIIDEVTDTSVLIASALLRLVSMLLCARVVRETAETSWMQFTFNWQFSERGMTTAALIRTARSQLEPANPVAESRAWLRAVANDDAMRVRARDAARTHMRVGADLRVVTGIAADANPVETAAAASHALAAVRAAVRAHVHVYNEPPVQGWTAILRQRTAHTLTAPVAIALRALRRSLRCCGVQRSARAAAAAPAYNLARGLNATNAALDAAHVFAPARMNVFTAACARACVRAPAVAARAYVGDSSRVAAAAHTMSTLVTRNDAHMFLYMDAAVACAAAGVYACVQYTASNAHERASCGRGFVSEALWGEGDPPAPSLCVHLGADAESAHSNMDARMRPPVASVFISLIRALHLMAASSPQVYADACARMPSPVLAAIARAALEED